AFSEKAFLETKETTKNKCILCSASYTKDDIISLNMSQAEQDKIKNEILKQRAEKVNVLGIFFCSYSDSRSKREMLRRKKRKAKLEIWMSMRRLRRS
ncbi:MAG TPA: replication termination factor 2 family protein, partial [Candidatus Dojkabacteria bacterium]|nr:replication termination factor 2 family protein [Candidatus Dojkabacteria bacterium]